MRLSHAEGYFRYVIIVIVNKYNRGIAKVKRELEKDGSQPAQFDVNKKTEFRVTIRAKHLESGQINPGSGQINPGSGQIIGARLYDIDSQDSSVLQVIQNCPGIKLDAIFLAVKTSTRSVRRALARLSQKEKIEYRGSRRTGGWYART